MTAIVSFVNLMLGFVCGYAVSLIITIDESSELRLKLVEKQTLIKNLQTTIDDLEEEVDAERGKKEKLIRKLNSLVRLYDPLPAPEGPLERCQACSDCDSDEDEVNCPVSPDLNPEHKG